jgi:pyrroloquinoline quinone (PQQ) biosynthesis protein C
MKGTEFMRGIYTASGLSIKPKTTSNRIETLKEIVRSFGLNPDEILTKEALAKPHRTVIKAGIETHQTDTLLEALKQKLKQELATETTPKTVEVTK